MQLVQKLFNKKPQFIKVYADVGLHAALFSAKALGLYLRHLITIQGGDPDVEPGSAFRYALQHGFDYLHSPNLDADLDHKWIKERFKKVNSKYPDMSEADYARLTDISMWKSPEPPCEDFSTIERTESTTVDPIEADLNMVEQEIELGKLFPSAPLEEIQEVVKDLPKQREREREKKIEDFLDEKAKVRLEALKKFLAEEESVEDVKTLVEKGKSLKETMDTIRSGLGPARRASKFKGSFTRGK